jgi:hypothetical protein
MSISSLLQPLLRIASDRIAADSSVFKVSARIASALPVMHLAALSTAP